MNSFNSESFGDTTEIVGGALAIKASTPVFVILSIANHIFCDILLVYNISFDISEDIPSIS